MALAFSDIDDSRTLARAIVDTVREPLLVLDEGLRVVVASRSFYRTFQLTPDSVEGKRLEALGAAWDIPVLQLLLEKIIPDQTAIDGFEIEHEFPAIGHRIMLLNAREVFYAHGSYKSLLLSLEDVTARRTAERQKASFLRHTEELLRQKEVLIQEMQHRIANSLQLIASILLLKSRSVTSEETRQHLQDAHQRVMSVAAVQQHLRVAGRGDLIEIGPYLSKLCRSLTASMIGDTRPITLSVACDEGAALSAKAVSLGLIVTELVINALKHAFPANAGGTITVRYEVNGADWMLIVADNGVGKPLESSGGAVRGLGTSIVNALAQQLDAQVAVASSDLGTKVSVTRATFTSRLPGV
ncbi:MULTISPECIES: histidine kinase dimerization/phosphoacceptor domain -containing protein [Rhodomicrobium]|uniref:sensor histidine kinase n=1 Tax=Rhodomicrobium TaxID=1068 RepID=UPI000B4BA189|nr:MULTISPECIES: histidine kinase dimerization/phosphoacceptor domain -containing protein [Rhodomicrobium]